MAEEILSEDELNALLDSIEEGTTDAANRPQRVVDYDFARPDKLHAEQVRSLQRLHETIAQEMATALSRLLRIGVEVQLVSLGQLSFDVFRNSLANPTMLQVLTMEPLHEHAILNVDIKLAFSLIDRLLGGPGKSLDRVRPLTMVEESLLDNVTSKFLAEIAHGWAKLQRFTFNVIERDSDPQFAQVIPPGELVLVATFGIQAPGELEAGEICYCLPFISLEEATSKLGSQARFADLRRPQTSDQKVFLDRAVNETLVDVILEFGTANLTIGEVLALKTGDVVVLDQTVGTPMWGKIADKPKFTAAPGRIGRKVACLVQDVCPEGPREDGGLPTHPPGGSTPTPAAKPPAGPAKGPRKEEPHVRPR